MERKIGEIFEFKKDWYQCVEGRCKDCHFSEKRFLCKQFITKDFCTHGIIFKKLEKVGEPYSDYLPSGRVIYFQKYECYQKPTCTVDITHLTDDINIDIEIKQTKKDMEEYKMYDAKEDIPEFDKVVDECLFGEDKPNLKPFDLEAAKLGKPVCTRDGRKARIICFDANSFRPIIALVNTTDEDGREFEMIENYYNSGQHYDGVDSHTDLMMLTEKKEGWVNVYNSLGVVTFSHNPYDTKKEALANAKPKDYVDTVKINWKE